MQKFVFRLLVIGLLGAAGAGAWLFGSEFNRQRKLENDTASAMIVPLEALNELLGEARVYEQFLPIALVNDTIWHLTLITLELESSDDEAALQIEVTQNFRAEPWGPGELNERDVFLAPEWAGRMVQYRVVGAEGFQ